MKKILLASFALCALSLFARAADEKVEAAAPAKAEGAAPVEKTLLVKITDHAEAVTYQVMPLAEFQDLQKKIAREAKLHNKALDAAEKAWKKDEDTKNQYFPRSCVHIRTAKSVGEYTDSTRAQSALDAKKKEQAAKEKAGQDSAADKAKGASKMKSAVLADKEKRDALYAAARTVYGSALDDLITKADAAAPGNEKKDAKDNADKDQKNK